MDNTTKTSIALGDLQAAVNLIDICSKRGAFSGEELSAVGALRDKLKAFVDDHLPKKEDETHAQTEPTPAQTEPTPAE